MNFDIQLRSPSGANDAASQISTTTEAMQQSHGNNLDSFQGAAVPSNTSNLTGSRQATDPKTQMPKDLLTSAVTPKISIVLEQDGAQDELIQDGACLGDTQIIDEEAPEQYWISAGEGSFMGYLSSDDEELERSDPKLTTCVICSYVDPNHVHEHKARGPARITPSNRLRPAFRIQRTPKVTPIPQKRSYLGLQSSKHNPRRTSKSSSSSRIVIKGDDSALSINQDNAPAATL